MPPGSQKLALGISLGFWYSAFVMRETETLLVVDGQNDTLSVPIMLSRQGFNVIRSNCASEALRLFAELPELDVDLLMVDLVLPEMNGVDLVHHVRKLR